MTRVYAAAIIIVILSLAAAYQAGTLLRAEKPKLVILPEVMVREKLKVCSEDKIKMLRTAAAIHRGGHPHTPGEDRVMLLKLAEDQLAECWR